MLLMASLRASLGLKCWSQLEFIDLFQHFQQVDLPIKEKGVNF